jgi:hypothetical protein
VKSEDRKKAEIRNPKRQLQNSPHKTPKNKDFFVFFWLTIDLTLSDFRRRVSRQPGKICNISGCPDWFSEVDWLSDEDRATLPLLEFGVPIAERKDTAPIVKGRRIIDEPSVVNVSTSRHSSVVDTEWGLICDKKNIVRPDSFETA